MQRGRFRLHYSQGKKYKSLVKRKSVIAKFIDFPHRIDDLLEDGFGLVDSKKCIKSLFCWQDDFKNIEKEKEKMCTCISCQEKEFYFGRTLDLDTPFGEQVIVTPRNFPLRFADGKFHKHHYAIIGMGAGERSYPLYADAVNEKGLCMAGLNFPGRTCYGKNGKEPQKIPSFDLIPWILGCCKTVEEAREKLEKTWVTDETFRPQMPSAPLHWMISDKKQSLVVEPKEGKMHFYDNPIGVMTNNPPFPYHKEHLIHHMNLTSKYPENRFSDKLNLKPFSQGMGAIGLPGDDSSVSRFVRAAFLKWNSPWGEKDDVTQFFHVLDGVSMIKGSVITKEGRMDFTRYACCIDAKNGIYYYKTYENSRIQAISLKEIKIQEERLSFFEIGKEQEIHKIRK